MRTQPCGTCGNATPLGGLFAVGQAVSCRACLDRAEAAVVPAGGGKAGPEPRPLLDPTVCAFCKADGGDREYQRIAGAPACDPCSVRLRSRPLPLWVRAAFILLLVLLVPAIVRGRGYYAAELALLRGERFAAEARWAEASREFEQVLATAPECRKAVLLKIKADVLSDNGEAADAGVERAAHMKFEGGLINEVNALLARAAKGRQEFVDGLKAAAEKKDAEALRHFEAAHRNFPESRAFRVTHLFARASAAFGRKEYDAYLRDTEEAAGLSPEDPHVQAALASALAARYALAGDEAARRRAEGLLARARGLCRTPEDHAAFEEYRERIEFRLTSKEVIDKDEYDRRFRTGKDK